MEKMFMGYKMVLRSGAATVLVALFLFFGTAFGVNASDTVTVFAAASTTNAIGEIGGMFVERKLGRFLPSFAASSTLAKQIENGAPATVYVSANKAWMDYLETKDLIEPASRCNLLANRIVLIAPAESPLDNVAVGPGFRLKDLLDGGYLAMGDPDHVPAGIYGKKALEALGAWDEIGNRIARQKDVRSAMALVERGEVTLGVVYATDAAVTEKVKVVGVFPESSHPPIVYPVAIVKGNETAAARRFLEFLKSGDARAVFEKYGFAIP
jgi:molybdate transport system substrate-binding protein